MRVFVTLLLVCICTGCWADALPRERVIKAIIGEAENQGSMGMLYVACAIRNRGTLKGVYGEKAPRVKAHLYTDKVYQQASIAWDRSVDALACGDIQGASHWENTNAFGLPYWARKMRVVFVWKDHKFFK